MLLSLIESLDLPIISLPAFIIFFILAAFAVRSEKIELIFVKAVSSLPDNKKLVKVGHSERITCAIAWGLYSLGYLKNRTTEFRFANPYVDPEYVVGQIVQVRQTIYELDVKGLEAIQNGRLGLRFTLATIGGLLALLITANSFVQALCSFVGLEFACILISDCPC